MPQMAPISWMSLYLIFSLCLIMFSMLNYYMMTPTSKKTMYEIKNLTKSVNWKW